MFLGLNIKAKAQTISVEQEARNTISRLIPELNLKDYQIEELEKTISNYKLKMLNVAYTFREMNDPAQAKIKLKNAKEELFLFSSEILTPEQLEKLKTIINQKPNF